jgi:hypothetical protein
MSTAEYKRELLSAAVLMLEHPDWAHIRVCGAAYTRAELCRKIRESISGGVQNDVEIQHLRALQAMINECAPYLKPGETPAQGLKRQRIDLNGLSKLLCPPPAPRPPDTERMQERIAYHKEAARLFYAQAARLGGDIGAFSRTSGVYHAAEARRLEAENATPCPYDRFKPGRDVG